MITDPPAVSRLQRLDPKAPVGLRAEGCLALYSHLSACRRCVEHCPAGVLQFTGQGFELRDGCLGCGRCAAVCPTGALGVQGFDISGATPQRGTGIVVDCWRVPPAISSAGAVRVPCLGGLTPSQLLLLYLLARGWPVTLLDRGWCATCSAGCKGAGAHPAQEILSRVDAWLQALGVSATSRPRLLSAPLPVEVRCQDIPPVSAQKPLDRRQFLRRAAGEVAANVSMTPDDLTCIGHDHRAFSGQNGDRFLFERRRQQLTLELIAAQQRRPLPAEFFSTLAIDIRCQYHGLCAAVCPTHALHRDQAVESFTLRFDPEACIACGVCVRACPEKAVRLAPAGRRARAASRARVLTRASMRNCAHCAQRFAPANGADELCPTCDRSQEVARHAFDAFFRQHRA